MKWKVEYTEEAQQDMDDLDHSQRIPVLKAIDKVSANPLPNTEGGYGKPLGNYTSAKLAGYLKIKLKKLGLRVVYRLERSENIMNIVIVSVRSDNAVYKMAQERIK
jgi:mRNA interferase RelE/StbE